jgi:hypothetical protein
MIFNFYNVLGKPVMQCFASVRMAKLVMRLEPSHADY